MENGLAPSHKKYQPDRPDILWNADWGIPWEEVSKEDAVSKGFRSYRGRWVAAEQRKILKDQYAAYRSIRVVSGLMVFSGAMIMLFLFIGATKSNLRELLVATAVIWGGLTCAAGLGLWSFRRWARNLTALVLVLSILGLLSRSAATGGQSQLISILMALLCLYYLFRNTAQQIFGTRVASSKPENTINLEDLAKDISGGFLSRAGLLVKYSLTEDMLRRHCDHFMYARKMSESDYLRIIGEPFVIQAQG